VTTDLVGFLASTYLRGVPLVLIPSTLLAMVDAAIGGKTGINTQFGKNLIGTFYPAHKILIDPTLLTSLPLSEWTNGTAEVIKYALIHSPGLFELLLQWNPKDAAYMEQIIHECILIKTRVVEADFEEKMGLRRILNFGHTIGHALELLENYRLPHGEAVAIGMLTEGLLSVKTGHLSQAAFFEIQKMIRSFPFRLILSKSITAKKMSSALLSDKKSTGGKTRFVLLEKTGACHPFAGDYCTPVPDPLLEETLSWMFSEFCKGGA
jgi:3-dehydroquinate synthase